MGIDGTEAKRRKKKAERFTENINKKTKRKETKDLSKVSFIRIAIPILIFAAVLGYITFVYVPAEYDAHRSVTPQPSVKHAEQSNREPGEIKQDLGQKTISFGSQHQAKELLRIIDIFKNKTEYQISYTTSDDIVIFGCDFTRNILLRTHNERDGHGKVEKWQGHILYRLKSAATGGSLNDTPDGKIFAQTATF